MYGLGIAWRLAILLVATVGPLGLLADGNVGCLYSEQLCVPNEEWCYDDHAFGRCLPGFGSVVDEDLFQYDLDRATLHSFEREMNRLFTLGYRWSHAYTQCELQALLYSAKNDIEFDNTICDHLVDQDLEGALMSLESGEMVDPESTAYVRYTPSDSNPNAEFADEIYFPRNIDPLQYENREIMENRIDQPEDFVEAITHLYPPVKRIWIPAMHRRSPKLTIPYPTKFFQNHNNEVDYEKLEKYIPYLDYLNGMKYIPEDLPVIVPNENDVAFENLLEEYLESYRKDREDRNRQRILNDWINEENFRYLKEVEDQESVLPRMNPEPRRFSENYNTPDRFRSGWEVRDAIPSSLLQEKVPELFDQRVYIDENEEFPEQESGSGENTHPPEIFRELKQQRELETNSLPSEHPETPTIFTEGGPLYPQLSGENSKQLEQILKNDLGKFLDEYDIMGFKRRERLDVKKPGPPFDERIMDTTEPNHETSINKNILPTDTSAKIPGNILEERLLMEKELVPPIIKKSPRGGIHPDPMHDLVAFDVDTDYVYIGLKDSVTTWKKGNEIIWHISNFLGLDPKTFSHMRVGRNEVTFRVEPNNLNLNATDVANKIDTIKDRLKEELGIEIVSAGVGDVVKMPAVMTVKPQPSIRVHFMLMIFCGILAAILLGVLVLVIIRRQVLSRRKLHNLAQQDTEASKDYQDLCRARMATKGQQPVSEKSEGVYGRITSLSRESEGSQHSPSSRSSTSSWSEEPSLTNMDISTGHMVLTYMEDHLKNKDRLEQEWVALCAYEADPCSTAIALKPENVKKNRYMEILPYDHSRVVLNELANASNTDFINASSITDHDPRNPAYIATEGPLPHTAPDFWQMVWEQGSVVMVMLTRLTENGNAMCHRYWPEEGSEVYHIYEVHLVSEHIWCDDYLVRSFYLKNVKTGETRTVTQFHFLSWPEHGIPTSTKALLEFRRKVNKSYRGRSCPIVVHCSDGAGRTGTYTLIDMVLNRMAKGAKEIDIAATLEHIRDQRMRMVATKQQFEFVLMAVAEEVHAILKALPAQIEKMEKAANNEK